MNIVVSTSNGAVNINSTVYLACVASGSTALSIKWTKSRITNITNSTSCRVSHAVYTKTPTLSYDTFLEILQQLAEYFKAIQEWHE